MRKNIIPTVKKLLTLPEDVVAKVDLFLFSDLEQRVPQGAYQAFYVARIKEFFDWQRLPLEPYGFPPGFFVAGPKEMIARLEAKLKGEQA